MSLGVLLGGIQEGGMSSGWEIGYYGGETEWFLPEDRMVSLYLVVKFGFSCDCERLCWHVIGLWFLR